MAPNPNFNKCEFISSEINHDFNIPKPSLDQYQNGWQNSTTCGSRLPPSEQFPSGSDGDDGLVKKILGLTKEELKTAAANSGDNLLVLERVLVSPSGLNLSWPVTEATDWVQPKSMPLNMRVGKASTKTTDPNEIYNIFRYPDENFLIIDAVSDVVTSILKYLQFPSVLADEDPLPYTNYTMEQLNQRPSQNWPFRPKINIINTPTTQGDPNKGGDPGAIKFGIDNLLPPDVLTSNTCEIPDQNRLVGYACPLIFNWYYTQKEISLPNNPIMMSSYSISTQPSGVGYRQLQDWKQSDVKGYPGKTLENSGFENSINQLKKLMNPLYQPGTNQISQKKMPEASFYVQRKRSGDYLQIKTAYEFPAIAANYANQRGVYELILGPKNAMVPKTTLGGDGNLKQRPINRNTKWYRNRTYFVTGDWPAFCYATYNRINCIILCRRGGCSGDPNTNILFSNYFGD